MMKILRKITKLLNTTKEMRQGFEEYKIPDDTYYHIFIPTKADS